MSQDAEPQRRLCVEVPVERDGWLDDLPPAPATTSVTVSFCDDGLLRRDGASIGELGYVVAGVAGVPGAGRAAHLVVDATVADRHARWWRAVLDLASRVLDPRFGPVRLALRAVLAAHEAAAGPGAVMPVRPRPPGAGAAPWRPSA